MTNEYEKLLDEAYKKVKKPEHSGERFEIPKSKIIGEGNKTIITNFTQISSYLRRNPDHLQKFLLKELAASGKKEGERLILNRKIAKSSIDEKINLYAKQFVICKECKKPDTEITHEHRISFIHCLACGAKHPVQKV